MTAPFQARENVGIVAARDQMLSSARPWMRQETAAGLKTQGKALVVPAPSPTVAPYTEATVSVPSVVILLVLAQATDGSSILSPGAASCSTTLNRTAPRATRWRISSSR